MYKVERYIEEKAYSVKKDIFSFRCGFPSLSFERNCIILDFQTQYSIYREWTQVNTEYTRFMSHTRAHNHFESGRDSQCNAHVMSTLHKWVQWLWLGCYTAHIHHIFFNFRVHLKNLFNYFVWLESSLNSITHEYTSIGPYTHTQCSHLLKAYT